MVESVMQILVVWAIVVHVAFEARIHFRTRNVLHRQRHVTSLGPVMESREWWKGWRYVGMLSFHLLLAWVVTFDTMPIGFWWRMAIYCVALLVMVVSSRRGLALIRALEEESGETDPGVLVTSCRYLRDLWRRPGGRWRGDVER